MNFKKRLLYFSIGIFLGCLLVYVLLLRGRDLPAWTPTDRVKEEITWDSIRVSDKLQLNMNQEQLKAAVNGSDIHFDKSKVRSKPCRIYEMTTEDEHEMSISICDSVCTVVRFN